MKKSNGGPAFPVVGTPHDVSVNEGMTLRDYFAAHALQGILAGQKNIAPPQGGTIGEGLAAKAYKLADAMLSERAK